MNIITGKEAVKSGLKRYFTGKPCKHGHISERYLDRRCAACDKSRGEKSRKKDSAKATERACKWQKDNPEKANLSSSNKF